MGTGNLTELTDADSSGVTALLLGICSELHIRNVLVVQVSPHTRRTIEEHDAARRIMFAARADASLPRDYGAALLQVHDRKPFPDTPRRDRRDRRARYATTISASRSRRTASTSTIGTDTTSRRMRWRCSPGSASNATARMRSISAPN